MRGPIVLTLVVATFSVASGSITPAASAQLPRAMYCGKLTVKVNQPSGEGGPKRKSGYLSTRGLSCRLAKITARNIAAQYRGAQGYVVRRNTLDCDAYPGLILDCVGIRPGDEDPTIAVTLRTRRR